MSKWIHSQPKNAAPPALKPYVRLALRLSVDGEELSDMSQPALRMRGLLARLCNLHGDERTLGNHDVLVNVF